VAAATPPKNAGRAAGTRDGKPSPSDPKPAASTREDDAPINLGVRSMGARIYKTYRVYEKPLV
jgi:hypothetical protein